MIKKFKKKKKYLIMRFLILFLNYVLTKIKKEVNKSLSFIILEKPFKHEINPEIEILNQA